MYNILLFSNDKLTNKIQLSNIHDYIGFAVQMLCTVGVGHGIKHDEVVN